MVDSGFSSEAGVFVGVTVGGGGVSVASGVVVAFGVRVGVGIGVGIGGRGLVSAIAPCSMSQRPRAGLGM